MTSKSHDLPLSQLRLKKTAYALVLAGLVSLSGCGSSDNTAPTPAAAAGVVVSGSVGSVAPAPGSASKAAALADATIEVGLYTKADALVDSQVQISNAAGDYEVTVNDPDAKLANGGYLVVTIKRSGFSDFSNRIDFDTLPDRLQIPAAQLSSVVTTVSTVGGSLTASASNGSFVMGIVRMRDGSQQALAGSQYLAAKANGAATELEIDIPAASLPGVETIKGQLKSFDSSDATDARSFPGAYRDTDVNTIVSLGFDYMNLTDGDTGQNLGQVARVVRAARGLRKAAVNWTTPTIVTRYLPRGSANNLLQDACDDPVKDDIPIADNSSNCAALHLADQANPVQSLGNEAQDGFQVPIYTYDPVKGLWDLFGIGSLVEDYNGNMLTYAEVAAFYSKQVSDVTAADFRAYAFTHDLNVRIYVANENFQRQYWNLDYPLLFAAPVTLCVQGQVTREDTGDAVSGAYLSFGDNSDGEQTFSYGSASTDARGNYKISVILQSNAGDQADDRTGLLSYYNNFDRSYESVTADVATSPNCATKNIVITPPPLATVRGRVIGRDGNPKAGEWVWGQGGIRSFSATTDSDGRFSAEVRQATTYSVSLGNDGLTRGMFHASGSVNGMESRDSTTLVELIDINLTNRAPYAYGYPYSSSLRIKGGVNSSATTAATKLNLWGYDYDGDFPLAWQVLSGATCNSDGAFSGGTATGLSGSFTSREYTTDVDISLTAGQHNLVLGLTDSAGKQGCTSLQTIYVAIPEANRAPLIGRLNADQSNYEKGATMTFTGSAFELDEDDKDDMTGSWSISAGTLNCTSPSAVTANTVSTCTATAPVADTPVTLTWTVSDGELESSRSIQVQVGTPPSDLNVIVR